MADTSATNPDTLVLDGPVMPTETGAAPPRGRGRRVLRRLGIGVAVVLVIGVVGGELFARFYLGMGDPPLYQADPEIEYLPVAGKSYRRFGNRIAYNSHSMRSPEFPVKKADPAELRVMVIGDSIVNGGAPSDDSELATTLLPELITAELKRPAVVGNISAGSWGPANQLAYVKKFGLFDADVVVIVLNSEDASDAPTFAPLGPEAPTAKPVLALQELLLSYGPKAFRYHVLGEKDEGRPGAGPSEEDTRSSLAALQQLVEMAREARAEVVLVHHFKLQELQSGRPEDGYERLRSLASRIGIRYVDTRAEMLELLRERQVGYRDWIHPDAAGQEALARVLVREVATALRR